MAQPDYKSVLADFMADINEKEYSDEELLQAYPEFNNDPKMLDAAYSYAASVKEKNYDEPTLQSKYPEFFAPAQTAQPAQQKNPRVKDYPAPTTEEEYRENLRRQEEADREALGLSSKPVQGRELKMDEVVRPQGYENLSDEELNAQMEQLTGNVHEHEQKARELYKARYGKDYVEPEEPTSWWDKYGYGQKGMQYRAEKQRYAEAVLDASLIAEQNDPGQAKRRNEQVATLRQEQAYRNQQEAMPKLGEEIKDLQQRILTNEKQDGMDMRGAKHLLNQTIDLYNAPSKYGRGKGVVNWGKGLADQITDYDTWTAGVTELVRYGNLNGIVNKMNKNEKLTKEEELLLETFLMSTAVQDMRSDLSTGYEIGKGAAESIPFMVEMYLTAGAGAAAKRGLVQLAERKVGQAFAEKLARSLGGTVIRDAAGHMVERGATRTVAGKVGKTLAYDFTQTAVMPSTYANIYKDRVSEVLQGDGNYGFMDLARSFTGQMVETGTERWGGRIIDRGMSKMIPIDATALWGKNKLFGHFVENYINSPIGETGEEVIAAGVNTLRSFNPFYSNVDEKSVSSNQRLRGELGEMLSPEGLGKTFLIILPMSVFGGGANAAINRIAANAVVKDYGQSRQALQGLLQSSGATAEEANRIVSQIEASDSDRTFFDKMSITYNNLLNKYRAEHPNMRAEQDAYQQQLDQVLGNYTKQAGAYNQMVGDLMEKYEKLPEEEKRNVDSAMEDYMVRSAEELAAKQQQPQDRQTQLLKQANEAAQQEIQSIAHKDGNVYRVGIKGKDGVEGYAMSGALDIQQAEDGTLSTRGRDLITIKMTDGTVEQVPADEVTLLDAPASAADRVQAVTDHLFAQYANNDLFQIGDKVHIMQDGQPSEDSSTIVNITDEGVEVEIIDPNGQPNTTVIPHEQAAEMLSKAEGTEDGIVTFQMRDGNTVRLRDMGDGVYNTIVPEGELAEIFTEEELAEAGAVRAEEAPVGESNQNPQGLDTQTPMGNGNETPGAAPAYPTDEEGNPAWGQIEVPQAAQILYDTFKQNNTAAISYADDQLKEAEKVQKQAAKQKSHSLNIAQRIAEDEQNAAFKAAADAAVKYWQDVKLAIAQIKTAEELAAEQAQRDAMMAAREQRSKTEEGTVTAPTMAERYAAADKIEGNTGTMTLPDGRELSGRYMLIAPQGVTPSHDVTKNFQRSDGYPVTSNGQSINDRDYTSDQEEQQKVQSIAQNFNGNAIKNMPVISDEGLVYNGNGRMMAGQLAALNGTDAAYTQSLMNNAAQYGFTTEQVASIPNARVVFQLDERLPYSTQSLAIFNEQETQTQSNTGRAAGYARKLTPQAISEVLAAVDGFNTIDAFFSDKKAPFNLINSLINAGIIAQREKAEMVDGDKLSATGRERLSNILFGTVFDNETIRLMGDDAALKNSILRALPQILDNKSLGEFSLEADINDAIRLLYQVRNAGMPFRSFVSQTVIAEDGQVHTAAEGYSPFQLLLAEEMSEGGVDAFRDVLTAYNNEARNVQGGQVDIFGDLLTQTQLKNLILQRYGKEPNEQERPSASREADNPAESTPASNEPAEQITLSDGRVVTPATIEKKDFALLPEGLTPIQIFLIGTKANMAQIPDIKLEGAGFNNDARSLVFHMLPDGKKDLNKLRDIYFAAQKEYVSEPNKTEAYKIAANEALKEIRRRIAYLDEHDYDHGRTGSALEERLSDAELAVAEAETDTNPTEAQKKAENYKQGHVTLWGLPITIENPKGSIRRGTDANGKKWEQKMNNTYGKIRRTEGVDGDHIDVFIGPNLTSDKVFVVDQRNVNNGEFDEHKVMLGFDSLEDAQNGYLSNYEEGWQGMGTVTEVTMDEFKKWIDSSHRKTKPFAEYKSVKPEGAAATAMEQPAQEQDQPEPVRAKHAFEVTISDINGFIDRCANNYFKNYALNNDALDTFYDQQVGKHILAGAPYVDGAYLLEVLHTANEELDKLKGKRDKYSSIKKRVFSNLVRDIQAGLSQPVSVGENAENSIKDTKNAKNSTKNAENPQNSLKSEEKVVNLQRQSAEEAAADVFPRFDVGAKVLYKKQYHAVIEEINYNDATYILSYPNALGIDTKLIGIKQEDLEDDGGTPPSGPAPTKPKRNQEQTTEQLGTNNSEVVSKQPRNQQQANFESNSVFTADAVAEARKRLAARRNRLNMGLNPEDAYDYTIIAGAYVEQGVRKFADFCKAMIQDLGDAVRPYLQSIYDSLRHDPQVKAQGWNKDFDSHDVVDNFDVDNFDYKERNMPEVRDYKDVNGQDIHIDDVSMSKSDGKLYYDLTITETSGRQRQTSVSVDTFNHELETKGIYPANEQPEEEETEPTAERTLGTIRQSKNTKTGAEIYVVSLTDHVSNDEFKVLKTRARANGGYYSSFAKNRGFIFNTEEDAKRFNTINDEEVTDAQTSANTEVVISQAETVAATAEAIERTEPDDSAEEGVIIISPEVAPTDEEFTEHKEAIEKIDAAIEQVNEQLAVLGYYEADTDDPLAFHESYGYLKSAEAKALKDVDRLAKQLAADLGVEVNKRKKLATANIAPAGGDISFRLPIKDGLELYVHLGINPNRDLYYKPDGIQESYVISDMYWRVENPNANGSPRYLTGNQNYGSLYGPYGHTFPTYEKLLKDIRYYAKNYLPEVKPEQVDVPELPANPTMMDVVEQAKARKEAITKKRSKNSVQDGQQVLSLFDDVVEELNDGVRQEEEQNKEEDPRHGYKVGDEVIFRSKGSASRKPQKVKIVDFEKDGRPVVDSFGTNYITEIADWDDIEPINKDANGIDVPQGQVLLKNGELKYILMASHKHDLTEEGSEPTLESIMTTDGKSYKPEEITAYNQDGTIQQIDNGRTEVRNDGQRKGRTQKAGSAGQPADQNGTLGGSQRQTDEGTQSGGVGSSSEQHRVHDGERGLGTAGQRSTELVEEPVAEGERKNTHNFRYDPSDPAPTSPKARYDANMAAIRLLKQLQDEGRQATPEEQRVLAKFTGWGGLGEYFKGEPGTTYYAYNGEKSPYQIIKELLTDEELAAAQLSRNSAYYTPTAIIDQLWNIAERLGFKGGNILEGSAGIGNILAQMPQSISDRSNLQAVEIDDITAGILAQLYPDAETHHSGFEKVDIPNNSQDLVITNVPFVTGLRVHDPKEKDLSKRFRSIHDFCIAKNVRKLRQGGIGIFITTSGTLDSSKDLRAWLNTEGETDVIGAFRLNRETFGGTSATSDIIVVRKRVNGQQSPNAINVLDTAIGRIVPQEQDNGKTEDRKLIYNRYFVEHPENMGGEMGFGFEHGDTRWGGTTAGCYPSPAINQSERLNDFVDNMSANEAQTYTVQEPSPFVAPGTYETYEGAVPYGSLILNSKGEICRAYKGMAVPVEGITPTKVKGHEKAEVLKDYNALKAAVEELLRLQSQGVEDEGLNILMKKLNKVYDDFVKKYGYLNRNVSLSFLRNDVQWASMAALENVRETIDRNGKKKVEVTKTDVFSKRVVGVQPTPKADNAKDGVILSVQQYGNVRPDRIAEWLGKPQDEVEKEIIASRLAFRDPQTGNMVVSHEYLSGNVREKLAYAEEHNENGEYDTNIEELRKVIPVDIPAHLIEFNIGSTWIPVELYHEYLKEKLGVDSLQLTHVGSAWLSNEKSWGTYSLHGEKNRSEGVYSELLKQQIYGHQLMIAAMNNVPVVVSQVQKHYDGTTETITDKVATAACSDKISQIKDDFVEWARGKMQQDPELAERVQKIYNERFNAIVPMLSVDKAFLSPHLPGQNPKYTLYDHQQQAVVRGTTQPIMLAHEVGTGKTITLISTAMEMRRLGTAKKPMIVVQNATTPQFVKEAKDLYPNAKILTVSERDRTKEGRQEFYAKIKYNDWDLIIVPQSVFDMIPDSEARMRDFIQDKIDEKLHAIEAAKEAKVDEKVTKRMERELEALKEDLQNANMSGKKSSGKKSTEKDAKKKAEQIANATAQAEEMLDRRTDEVEDFDDMGIDALLIDEAHNYKHLGFATMMTRGVKGIDPSYSKRAAALFLKCQSIYDRKGHRNVVFATGTPISNTAAEIWTFMKYLMPKSVLQENDIYYFDDFVHNFGKIAEQLEFATNGKFKANNRFAQYGNVPELMRLWLTCADCVLTREVGQVNDKVPELEGGKAQDIFLPQSPSLIDIMASVRDELDTFEHMSGKEKKENSHIPLTMYGVAKRAAIDPRLVDATAADEPLSKTNKAVEETLRSLKETKKYNGTVAIFCDSYRNLQSGFNLFEDIKAKLVKGGVPAAKIAIIRSEMTDAAKQKIFDAVREGEIRVIMGSTQTLGTGVNIQTRLHTLIHMDAPDRPMDYTQRNGRIIRQGNMHRQWNIPVRVLRFGVEDSLDVTSYQRLKTKAGFIDSIMNGKSMIDNNLENRVIEDVEEGIFDNPVAMLSGSQYALLKSQAERDLRKWQARKQQHDIDQILIASGLKKNAQIIEYRKNLIAADEKFLQQLKETFPTGKVTEYNINGTVCHTPEELKAALKAVNKDISDQSDALRKNGYEGDKRNIGLALQFNGMTFNVNIVLTYKSRWEGGQRAITIDKEVQYTSPTSDTWLASPTKVIDKLVENIEQDYLSGAQAQGEINYSRSYIARLQQESELMRQREGKPFEHTAELERAQALVDEYTEKMKAELAEKEAKYANQSSGRKVELNEQEDEEESAPEAQIDNLDYPQFTNQTEAQQLATRALIETLNDNTDLDVFLATDEEAQSVLPKTPDASQVEHPMRSTYNTQGVTGETPEFSIRREAAPKKTGIGYKVFYRGKDGKLYPPMVANPNGADTPVGVWLNADAAPVVGETKTGRPQVKAGGKGTQGGSGTLAYRPGWHLGEIPYALQFNRKDENGQKTLFPKDFVWAEVEYAADVDYQQEANEAGINKNGNYEHAKAGLKHLPTNGYYRYRTNPNPETDPWIITGAMKVNRVLTNEEVDEIVRAAGREPQVREPMVTTDGTLYGWAIGDRIYLTKAGLNPNTPIHEYTHLWAKAMRRNNQEGWQSIVNIFKDTPFWQEVVEDENYASIRDNDDAICSEVLARYSGTRGAARMEEAAAEMLHEADQTDDLATFARTRRLISRVRQALSDFWHWVGVNLFGIKHFDSAEQVADRVLFDMLNGTELGDLTGSDTSETMVSKWTPEQMRAIQEWNEAHPHPQYQVGEKLDHYAQRLNQWEEARKQFRASMEGAKSTPGVYAPKPPVESTQNTPYLGTQTPGVYGTQTPVSAPAFVPGVKPTPTADESPAEYALRLKQYYQLMRDENLVADYVAEINAQADAAAKGLKKNTLVRGLLDAAKPIENFQEWMTQRGATMTDGSNAYTDTFLASGRVSQAHEQLTRDILRPLAKQIATIIAPDKATGKSRLDDINITWQNMDVPGTGSKIDGKALTPREIIGVYCQAKDCAEAIEKGLPDRGAKGFERNLGMTHDQIIAEVESRIPRAELDEMWRLINAATHFALNYDYESGRISEDTHTEFYQREFYVPQRGWRERDESALVTEYEPVGKRGHDPYNAALVKAHGRQSLAADPFAYIMSIDASSIISSENNKIKQKFLRFCLDNEDLGLKTGAFRIKKYWIMNVIDPETGRIKLDADGNPMMEVSYSAPSTEDLQHDKETKQQIQEKRKQLSKVRSAFEKQNEHGDMPESLQAAYETKIARLEQAIEDLENQMHIAWHATNTNISQRTSDEKKQHEVQVLLDGEKYVIELQDEKLANAINKKFKDHQESLFNTSDKIRQATRFMSAMLTQYNPEFAASNFARDYQVALATLMAEHRELVGPFMKYFATCQGVVWKYAFNDKVRDREAFADNEMGKYLREYFASGAPTGFSYMQDLKSLRRDFDAMVNESNVRRGIKGAVGVFSMLTEVSETAVRFAGFVAARKNGMGLNEAAYLSKELTTNFDRAGEVADTGWMAWFSFFRATLNGNLKFLKALKKMPLAYSLVAVSYFAMGMLNQFLNPDDPDDEIWASDYTRQSNFVLGKIRVPVAHFMRMFFGAGVNAAQWIQGNKTFGHAVYNTATFASQEMLPNYLNVLGNGTEWNSRDGNVDFTFTGLIQGAMPSPVSPITDVWFNRDFRGATINREPFTKAQEGKKDILMGKEHTLPIYKWLTQAVYEGVGGSMATEYKSADPAWRSWLFDISPSSVEHVVEGYIPAGADMFITLGEAIYDAATGTPTGPDKWPFVRKFYNAYTPERAYNQQYYLLNGRVKAFEKTLKDYQKNDPAQYRLLRNSQQYRTYQQTQRLVKSQSENPTTADVRALIEANKLWLK